MSLVDDFGPSGEPIHTRWFSLLVKRKPDTKAEMKSLRCRTGLCICGQARVGVSAFLFFLSFFSSIEIMKSFSERQKIND